MKIIQIMKIVLYLWGLMKKLVRRFRPRSWQMVLNTIAKILEIIEIVLKIANTFKPHCKLCPKHWAFNREIILIMPKGKM